ncbi:MAG: 3-dehydroquinate synthase II [Methanomicrobiales archaeon]|nr:3-dehydroquinate synthase II [Methanomicrobiales archaeon]
MKEFWVDARPFSKKIVTTAIESGADAIVTEEPEKVRRLGRIRTIGPAGDLIPGRDVHEIRIIDKESEEQAAVLARQGLVIVRTTDWTVIPLENLVAQSDQIIAAVTSVHEAELALGVLEKGVRGILLSTDDPAAVRAVGDLVKRKSGNVCLSPFTITEITPVGMGDRVCVDTCTLLGEGQGMLVGDTSSAFLLVHAETLENPYVEPRPFRVNAGAVHAYALMPGGKTAYLSELAGGDEVLVTDPCGGTTVATVGRVKIEHRPLLRIRAECGDVDASLILQNAETIRLVDETGRAISVVELAVGDRVLGVAGEGARHFGFSIRERIREK